MRLGVVCGGCQGVPRGSGGSLGSLGGVVSLGGFLGSL